MGKKKRSSSGKSQEAKTEQGKSWLIMNQMKPPEPFSFHESASWTNWIKRYKTFHSAVGLSSAGEDQQISMLLYCMGQEAEELLSSLGVTEEKRTSFNSVVTAFEEYFTMKKNIFYHRALFMERNQRPGEKVECYIDELSKLSEKCEWSCKNCKSKDFRDEMIFLKLITGINDKTLSKHLQRQEITTLSEGVKILRESELGKEKSSNADVLKDFTTLKIERENTTRPGTHEGEPHLFRREGKSSGSDYKANVKPVSHTPAIRHQECGSPTYFLPKNTFQEEKGNMRSSFSSGVDTGDEYAMDELAGNGYFYVAGGSHDRFYNEAASFERKASSASTASFCEDQRFIKRCGCRVVNCPHVTGERESASTIMRKLVTGDDDFDSDEEDQYLENIRDFQQKNYSSYTSEKTWSSTKSYPQLDDSWPELEKTIPKVNDEPKYCENYHFSVSGHQSRKYLRKMCQQRLKYSY